MSESNELKKIKKMYGEKFMKLCREFFPTILEHQGLLTKILTSSFSTNSRTLNEDIRQFGLEEELKNFVYSKVNVEKEKPEIIEEKTPYELLEEAGYDLYECNSEEDIQSFKKYYKSGEELCTFNGNRLDRCVVFWAVRKNVDEIKREDFESPIREDEYGTSVMSIQFSREKNSTVSIKNRYNHRVNNPDATYGNDLDRIIPGLTQSFEKLLSERGMELNSDNIELFEIPSYIVAGDGKYYKYNMEINGIYYCPGNVIIDQGRVIQLESEKQVLMDYFILDKEKKTLSLYDSNISDSFVDGFENIEKIEMRRDDEKEKGRRVITIKKENCDSPIIIEINKDNGIVEYEDINLTEVGHHFLFENSVLNRLEVPNLKSVGINFLCQNLALSQLEVPNLKRVGRSFLSSNKVLSYLKVPSLESTGGYFLSWNYGLSQLNVPNLESTGVDFLRWNHGLSQLEAPNLKKVGQNFLEYNKGLYQLSLPELEEVGDNFLKNNEGMNELILPKLVKVGNDFLLSHKRFSKIELPSLTSESKEKILYLFEEEKEEQGKGETIEKYIDSRDIAELDRVSEITTSEISWGKRVIEKVRSLFKRKENNQR